MMAQRLARMSASARAWYLERVIYLSDRDPGAARKFEAAIMTVRRTLVDYPKMGPAGMIPGTRRFVAKPYVLTVRQQDGVVEIGAIRHARQGDAYAPTDLLEEGRTIESHENEG